MKKWLLKSYKKKPSSSGADGEGDLITTPSSGSLQAPERAESGWTCPICTLNNPEQRLACEVCEAPRPDISTIEGPAMHDVEKMACTTGAPSVPLSSPASGHLPDVASTRASGLLASPLANASRVSRMENSPSVQPALAQPAPVQRVQPAPSPVEHTASEAFVPSLTFRLGLGMALNILIFTVPELGRCDSNIVAAEYAMFAFWLNSLAAARSSFAAGSFIYDAWWLVVFCCTVIMVSLLSLASPTTPVRALLGLAAKHRRGLTSAGLLYGAVGFTLEVLNVSSMLCTIFPRNACLSY
jgi:hypothetical protein